MTVILYILQMQQNWALADSSVNLMESRFVQQMTVWAWAVISYSWSSKIDCKRRLSMKSKKEENQDSEPWLLIWSCAIKVTLLKVLLSDGNNTNCLFQNEFVAAGTTNKETLCTKISSSTSEQVTTSHVPVAPFYAHCNVAHSLLLSLAYQLPHTLWDGTLQGKSSWCCVKDEVFW